MTHAELAQLQLAIYDYAGVTQPKWSWRGEVDGVYAGTVIEGNKMTVVFRGSTTLLDWLRDFNALALPIERSRVGKVHPGFYAGMEKIFDTVLWPYCPGRRVTVCGHSLGSAHAQIFAGMLTEEDWPVDQLVTWGPPKVGFAGHLDRILAGSPTRCTAYRNTYIGPGIHWHDPVTDVPLHIGLIEPYVWAVPITNCFAAPAAELWNEWKAAAPHHMCLYAEAMKGQTERERGEGAGG